jgi:hypothetical protein
LATFSTDLRDDFRRFRRFRLFFIFWTFWSPAGILYGPGPPRPGVTCWGGGVLRPPAPGASCWGSLTRCSQMGPPYTKQSAPAQNMKYEVCAPRRTRGPSWRRTCLFGWVRGCAARERSVGGSWAAGLGWRLWLRCDASTSFCSKRGTRRTATPTPQIRVQNVPFSQNTIFR